MDGFDSIIEKTHLMMAAYKDFRDLCDELRDERGLGNDGFGDFNSVKEEELNVDSDSWSMPLMSLISPPRSLDEFPEQISMAQSAWDVDAEDPELWTGKSLGIPVAVVVRQSNGDDKLLPIINGKFKSYGL